MLAVGALVLQRVDRFICDLPACPAPPHACGDMALASPQVRPLPRRGAPGPGSPPSPRCPCPAHPFSSP
jgi:hypothetical protein